MYAHLCTSVLPAGGTSLALDEPEVLRRCGPFAVVLEEVQAGSQVGELERGGVYLRARALVSGIACFSSAPSSHGLVWQRIVST
jgi:hypothetical protein